ncbi:MAG: alpha-amylase [Anaerolineae bacterium]|nr:alpha-amylase [Anaerolineae bacterium]
MRKHPLVYEINTWVWLNDLSSRYNKPITLASIPDEVIDELAGWGMDAIWTMGVWERSPRGREIALAHPDLQGDYNTALPGWKPQDVIGSPYAVHRYEVDAVLGGTDGLAKFRAQLRARQIGLILDYVPNHVAVDHPWTLEHPDFFINGTDADLANIPGAFFRASNGIHSGAVIANGRDPYFPAWTDTAQVNAFSPAFRSHMVTALLNIAQQCDGIRCDMAMLMVTRIFAQTWGTRAGKAPDTEFWQEVIPAVKKRAPNFLFMAEVYWDMEDELQRYGFDYTYDKRLYDRLRHEPPHAVRDHLLASLDYQSAMVRFVENHDESRAVTAFGVEGSLAGAVISAALPGMKLFHEGQFEGRRIKLPVQLGTRPAEPVNMQLRDFYKRLLTELQKPPYHEGAFMQLAANPILGEDNSHEQILAFAWALDKSWRIVAVNMVNTPVKGRLMIPNPAWRGTSPWRFEDVLTPGVVHLIPGDQVLSIGLALELAPHQACIFAVR